jgi:hypothetical protein
LAGGVLRWTARVQKTRMLRSRRQGFHMFDDVRPLDGPLGHTLQRRRRRVAEADQPAISMPASITQAIYVPFKDDGIQFCYPVDVNGNIVNYEDRMRYCPC